MRKVVVNISKSLWRLIRVNVLQKPIDLYFENEWGGTMAQDGWYVVLPDYPGPKANLKMVDGADVLLDTLLEHPDYKVDADIVAVRVSLKKTEGAIGLHKLDSYGYGRRYAYQYDGKWHGAWLCPVTLYVFGGYYPKHIYITPIPNDEL